jgi:hypothetical protein
MEAVKKLLVLLVILCGLVYYLLQKYLWFLKEYEMPVGWDK